MSLDVYLTLPEPTVQPERIFIRRDGATQQITREEWDALHPDREPVAVLPQAEDEREVFWANITHNMGRMAGEVGLYGPLWRPDEHGITDARQLIEPLREGLARLHAERERLQEFNPSNGWGNYDLLVSFTDDYLEACEQNPEAEVRVSR